MADGLGHWQDQLLPVDAVLDEEDVTVLRQELETAHNLLQYQQRLIDSLTEQLVDCETHHTQLQQDLETAQRDSHREAEKCEEFQSICQDLRSQLRRQQARIHEYKTVLKNNSNTFLPHTKVISRKTVSFGYAVAIDEPFVTSSSAVSPWSASDPINFSNAFAICCRNLAALGADQAAEQPPSPHLLEAPPAWEAQQPSTLAFGPPSPQLGPAPELPNFVH